MAQMMTGEVIWGGVGSGLYSMLLFVILGVFIAGLMVGRTPEFLGKKIEAREVKLTILGTIAVPMMVLVTTAVAIGSKWGAPSIYNGGPQGFSETLYAYTSQGNNNGSAFAGYTGYLQPNGTNDGAFGISFADVLGGLAMLGGRFLPMLAVLAIAGLARRQAGQPRGPRHAAHRHADVRRRAGRGRADRRPPHLRPRPAPRTRGPGPLRPALLTCENSRQQSSPSLALTVVLGLAYPLAMTGVAQVVFPGRADGSMIERDGKVVGSKLIGQDFSKQLRYFQSRPSATGYAPAATFFNNQGPNQQDLADQLQGYVDKYLKREGRYTPGLTAADLPSDAVTTSASGVDPDISEANARIQANRVAEKRGMDVADVRALIDDHTSRPLFGLAGDKSVNVLELNLALDQEASR